MNATTAPPAPAPPTQLVPAPDFEDLARDFLAGRNERTRRAYARDLKDFREFAGAPDVASSLRALLSAGAGPGNSMVLRFKNYLSVDRGLAPATVGRRLAALRSVSRLARTLGLVAWSVEIRSPRAEPARDTRGPGLEGVRALLATAAGDSPKARRDRAVLRLLHDLGLRRAEVASLDLGHLDGPHLLVLRKGRTRRQPVTVPPETRAALDDWIRARGDAPGPLLVSLDNRSRGHRLTPDGIYHLVRTAGRRAGFRATPHGLRHSAVTTGLELTRGDVRAVARFAGHASPATTIRYDDDRRDVGGEIARRLASVL